MLAIAVSQIKIEPNQKDTGRHVGRVAAEVRMSDRGQENATEYDPYTPTWSPPVAEKSVAHKKPAQAEQLENRFCKDGARLRCPTPDASGLT
jgi:hypothetical protein